MRGRAPPKGPSQPWWVTCAALWGLHQRVEADELFLKPRQLLDEKTWVVKLGVAGCTVCGKGNTGRRLEAQSHSSSVSVSGTKGFARGQRKSVYCVSHKLLSKLERKLLVNISSVWHML